MQPGHFGIKFSVTDSTDTECYPYYINDVYPEMTIKSWVEKHIDGLLEPDYIAKLDNKTELDINKTMKELGINTESHIFLRDGPHPCKDDPASHKRYLDEDSMTIEKDFSDIEEPKIIYTCKRCKRKVIKVPNFYIDVTDRYGKKLVEREYYN